MHDDDELLSNSQIAKRHNISLTTQWRGKNSPSLNYPPPDAIINGREFRRSGTMRKWEDSTRNNLTAKKPTHLRRKAKTEANAEA
jgi:hypothetical protein